MENLTFQLIAEKFGIICVRFTSENYSKLLEIMRRKQLQGYNVTIKAINN